MRPRIKPMLQLTRTECGLCCVAMICQYYGKIKSMSYYREKINVGRDGASIKDVVTALDEIGIRTTISRFEKNSFDKVNKPIIAIIDNNHFIVIERNKSFNKVIVNDPAIGKLVMDRQELESRVGRILVQTEVTPKFKKEKDIFEEWKPFFNILFSEKKMLSFTLLLSVIIYLGMILMPIVIQKNIDTLIKKNTLLLSESYIILGIIVLLLYIVTMLLKNIISVRLETNVDRKFLFAVVEKLINLKYQFYELRTSGDLLFRLNLVNNIRTLVSNVMVGVLDLIGVIFAIMYAMTISLKLCGMTTVVILFIAVITVKMNSLIVRLNYEELSDLTSITMAEAELVNSIFDIKSLHMEESFGEIIKASYEKFKEKFQKRNWWSKLYGSTLQLFQIILPVLLLLVNLHYKNNLKMTIGEIIAFYSISTMMISNSISFVQNYTNIKLMGNSLARINEILISEQGISGDKIIEDFQSLSIDNVSFSYTSKDNLVLKDINIHVKKGDKIAIVGESGSGKSTLTKLINGLYPAMGGSIFYNQTNINDISKDSLKELVGIVTQEAALFNKSIKDNVVLNRNVSKEELYEVLDRVGILDEIMSMPMKEETLISEFGKNISGGQRQRLAMARTLINKPKLLILDEATSSLDGFNESEISQFLDEIDCTQIIISHNISSIMHADYVYVLKNGKIVERGTIKDLTAEGTDFNRIFKAQKN